MNSIRALILLAVTSPKLILTIPITTINTPDVSMFDSDFYLQNVEKDLQQALQRIPSDLPNGTKDLKDVVNKNEKLTTLNAAQDPAITEIPGIEDIPGTSCGQPAVLMASVNTQSPSSPSIKVLNNVQFKLALQQTACFRLQLNESDSASNESKQDTQDAKKKYGDLMYTISYVRLEHVYNVWNRYEFGIPDIRTSCLCDCTGGDRLCTPEHTANNDILYKSNCTQPKICTNTFHPHMQATGCTAGSEAQACCNLGITPYMNWRFTAMSLSMPRYQATFEYKLFSRQGSNWILISERSVQASLNQLQSDEFDNGRMAMKVSGAEPIERLNSGYYFTFANETRLRVGVPINEVHEYSMDKLGWYRLQDSKWDIRQASAKLEDALKIRMTNCYEHQFSQSLVAEHYILSSKNKNIDDRVESYYIGSYLDERETWIGGVHLRAQAEDQRQLGIVHRGQHYVEIDLILSQMPLPVVVMHQAKFDDFYGKIQLDKFSNRFLNITFVNGSGTLIGSSYELGSDHERLDLAFSVYVAENEPLHNEIIDLPPTVMGDRRICFYPAGAAEKQKCKILVYEAVPLPSFQVPYGWVVGAGECDDCNHIGFDNFLKYLNPAEWLDGITGTGETVAVVFEVVVYVAILLVACLIIRKCVWPLVKCLWCGCNVFSLPSFSKKTQKANQVAAAV